MLGNRVVRDIIQQGVGRKYRLHSVFRAVFSKILRIVTILQQARNERERTPGEEFALESVRQFE